MRRHALVLAGILAAAAPLAAQEKPAPEAVNRSVTIDCVRARTGFTAPEMGFELDAIYYHTEIDRYRRSRVDLSGDALIATAAFGITDWVTAKAIVPILFHDYDPGDKESGIGDIGLEGKVSLRKDHSPIGFVPIDLAGGCVITLPTGDEDEGLGNEEATVQPYAAASYWFLSWLGAHGSAYFEFQSGEKPYYGMNATAEFVPWMKELSLLAALELRQRGSDSGAHVFIPGAEYRFTDMISAGMGLPLGLSNRAEDWGLILNAQISF